MSSLDEAKDLGDAVVDRETGQGFTPGPWRAVGYSPGWWQIEGPEREQIADVNYSDGLDEPTLYPEESNARLMAAAPALYKATKSALLWMERYFGEHAARKLPLDEGLIAELRAALALVNKPATESAKRPISNETQHGQASKTE